MGEHGPKSRLRRMRGAGTAVGLLVSAALVWQSSHAAFTDTTTNPGNTWTSGTVTVSDNRSGVKVFNLSGLKPGDSGDQCIQVTYQGTLANATINFYVDNFTDNSTGGAWGAGIKLTITTGGGSCPVGSITGSSTPINDVALSTLNSTYDFPAGSSMYAWSNPSTNDMRPYNVHYQVLNTLADDGDDGIQGKTATIDLVWEAVTS